MGQLPPPETNLSGQQGRSEGQQDGENVQAQPPLEKLALVVTEPQVWDSPRDNFSPLHQLNLHAFAALNNLSGPAFRAQGSAYMVSRGLAANAVVNDPTHQVGGGVLIPVLDEEELLNADPKLLEMLAEINCLNTNFELSLAGDRHPEVEGKAREEPPKRPRGTPQSQDSPPEAPSPKTLNDGVGGMEADAPVGPTVEAVSSTSHVVVSPPEAGIPPCGSLGALD